MPARLRHFLVALALPWALGACDGDGGVSASDLGALDVGAATTGDDVDPDGYVVVLGQESSALGVNETVRFTGT